jgi:hypothetical protein
MGRRTFFAAILILFCLANAVRWGYRSRLPHPRFVAEGAAHFRYARMVAGGNYIPALDVDAQYPEGLRVYRETTPGMEYLYGLVYRLFPRADLAAFVRYFTAFLFSLAIVPIAFISAGLWESRGAGVASAALFAVSLALVGRSSGFEFIRENVTFPLIIYHVYFLVRSCERRRPGSSVLSAIFLFIAASSWQGTQFYLVPLMAFLLARRVLSNIGDGERYAVRILIVAIVAAGVVLPFLREGRFLLSLPASLAYAWLAADVVKGGKWSAPALLVVKAAAAAAVVAAVVFAGAADGHFETYAHFFKLIAYKLRYVQKPADPSLLPFDVRAFWVGPFHAPDPRHVFVFALPLMVLLPPRLSRLVRRAREGDFTAIFVSVFLVLSFLFYLLMQRLLPFFGIFGALAAGGAVVAGGGRGGRGLIVSRIILAGVIAVSLLQDFAWEGPADIWRKASKVLRVPYREKFVIFPQQGDVEGALLSWIGRNTPEEAVVMTFHYLSPQVLTYTGRPTNLNDFFESPRLRKKAETFLKSLYSSEERLYRFCDEQSSDYLLLSIAAGCDPTSDSPIYQAGLVGMPPGCAAYRLLFEPERLTLFDLVYENEMYRLFKVGRAGTQRVWPRSPLFFDRELLWRFEGDIRAFYYEIMRIYAMTARGTELVRLNREPEAERFLADVLRNHYFYPAWRALMNLYRGRAGIAERESLAAFAYRSDPNRSDVCLELARIRIEAGKIPEAREILERCTLLYVTEGQKRELDGLLERIDQNR